MYTGIKVVRWNIQRGPGASADARKLPDDVTLQLTPEGYAEASWARTACATVLRRKGTSEALGESQSAGMRGDTSGVKLGD